MADDLTGAQKLAWHNRRVTAARLGWPTGVLEECERLDGEHPGWRVGWHSEDEVYNAIHTVRQLSFRWARARTLDELTAKMAEADKRAAEQRAEWELLQPHGWSVLKSQ